MNCRLATPADARLLARMNGELIRDEAHRNAMTLPELEQRMGRWLAGEYKAVLFERGAETLGYALFRREPEYIYLRQFFVCREFRRQGIGRSAVDWLVRNAWCGAGRIRLDVLVGNADGIAFWRAVGFRNYCVTMEMEYEALGVESLG